MNFAHNSETINRNYLFLDFEVDFPAFARHFLAWRNSLLQISLEKRLQCDYVV